MLWAKLTAGLVVLALVALVLAGVTLCERGYPEVGVPTLLAGAGTLWHLLRDEDTHED